MKKIFYALMVLATLSLAACNKELLNTNPTDRVSGDTVFGDTEGGLMALNGMIRMMWEWGWSVTGNAHQAIGPEGYNLMADLMGEDMVMAASGNGWFWYDYNYNVKSRYTASTWRSYDCWNYYYTLIANANYIIDAAEDMDGDPAEVNYIIGNAYALRAWCYAYCAMTFARSYVGHEDRLSIPIYTDPTFAGTSGKPRSTNREVFAQAMSDINTAIDLIGASAQKHVSHIDRYVANGIKARIALYMGDYQTAHDAALAALAGGASYAYDSTFKYNDAEHKSVLWGAEVISTQGTTNPQFLAHMDIAFGGYGKAARKCASAWLYGKLGANDKRAYDWWNYEVLADGSTKGYQQYKFLFKNPADPQTGADHIFMRAPEMQLIVAETACRMGNEVEAKSALNMLMHTRDAGYDCSALSGTALATITTDETGSLLEEILLQRRIELWGEYGRVYDIKRLRQGFVRTAEMGHPVSSLLNALHVNDPESFDWVLTIPTAETDANPYMVQNPVSSYATATEGDDPSLTPAVEAE